MEPARRVRMRTLRRWTLPVLTTMGLAASLATVVRRGEEGRRLSDELGELEARSLIVGDRILGERVRVDSLTTPSRIAEAAASIGLRRAGEGELIQLRESSGGDETGAVRGAEGME